jgi:O-antigen ligase
LKVFAAIIALLMSFVAQSKARLGRLFQETPADRLPFFAELGIVIFPLGTAWGAVAIFIQLVVLLGQSGKSIVRQPLAQIFGMLTLWLFFVSAIAPYPLDSVLGVSNYVPFFLFFLAYSRLFNSVARVERLAWLLVLPSLGVSLLGLGELWLDWKTPDLIWHLFGWDLTGTGEPPGRLSGTLMYANICAAYLVTVFLLGLGLWLKHFSWQNFSWQKSTQSKVFVYLTVTLLVDAIALVLTNSRNVWAIALLGVLIYAIYLGWWWICCFVGGFAAAVLGASFGKAPWRNGLRQIVPAYFWSRLSDQMYAGRPTPYLRTSQWQFVLEMIQQRPLTGWGIRSFTPSYEATMGVWLGHPHNLYLMITSEIGIPFAGLFIGTIGWIYVNSVQAWRKLPEKGEKLIFFSFLLAFGGLALFNTLDVTMMDLALNTFAWLILAGIWGLGQQINQSGDQRQGDGSPEEYQGEQFSS